MFVEWRVNDRVSKKEDEEIKLESEKEEVRDANLLRSCGLATAVTDNVETKRITHNEGTQTDES